ncbi:hypothetical protein [Formosa algae]|uniref:Uncharacterized protein n=1 Tax=Formosa algae TaxID=225843 RepID=A0A9X1CC02_9FLAO|nr:hypothetical protein [Formosa algae]MBP1840572.1 hypothetical protein [Formosa algae]MDQ0336015.1 hypothetical protein [Formosa algae]OEI81096.1 hypothetical protein AST99_05400 [Formosa algae]
MNIENIQTQLATQIMNHHKTWSNLLVNLELGNEASSYWDVTLEPTNISVELNNTFFTFKNAEFRFDINSGVSYGDDVSIFTKQVSGKGSYQFIDDKTIHLTELKIEA